MYATNVQTMQRYLAELVEGGDFTDIPKSPDVFLTGPLSATTGAAKYRSICQGFAEAVRGLSVRTIAGDDDVIHAVYDVDMGLASGPLPTSQTVEFAGGAFVSVEVIFDAAQITGTAS